MKEIYMDRVEFALDSNVPVNSSRNRFGKIAITFTLILLSFANSFSQCNWYTANTACTSNAPTVVGTSVSCTPPNNNGGRRNFVINNMTAGCTYRISNCGSGFDTQMTLRNAAGTVVGYNDDNGPACSGSASSIDFLCPATGQYWIQMNRYSCSTTNALNGTITVTLQGCCSPGGNPATYGTNAWIGYVYNSASAGAFTTYQGFVTEATTFNRTHSTASGATVAHCSGNQDLFAIRYRNTTNFAAGYYTFTVGGDDGVRFSIDGGSSWLINQWVDQGYSTTSNSTPVYLSGNTNMVFEYYENGGGSQSSFSYTFTPACSGTPTPGSTVTSAASVLTGGTVNLSLQNATTPATYQWQSSSSSTGPWTNISGATNSTYTATVSATTWYQCVVTCTTSSTSAASTPVQVTATACTPAPTSVDGTGITNVTFGVGPIVNNTTSTEVGNYGNYSSQVGAVYQGAAANVSITYSTGYTYGTKIWIDWNNDLVFTDATELMYTGLSASANPTTLVASLNIPTTAALGNYRIRIGGTDTDAGPSSACYNGTWGSFEDYTISIIALPSCSGTPAPGNTLASQTVFCSGTGSVNLSMSSTILSGGISYQWQSSIDGVSYSNVSGATSATYTTPTLSSTTYYQCLVACSAGGSAISTPVTIMFGTPSAPSATNSASCGPAIPTGTMTSTSGLTNPNLTWYTAASGGNVVLTSYTGALSSYYSNDFSSNTGIGVMTGNASLTGGVVQLTPNLGSQLGALTIPASGVSADKYNVSFNLITSNVAQSGADGVSYSFGDDISGTSTTVAAETGSGSKLKVSFDDYGTSGGGISGIRVIYGSTISDPGVTVGTNGILAYNASTAWTNANTPVVIDINNLGQLTLTVNGTAIFSNLQLPAAYLNANKSTWKHGFKSRTGGVSMIHSIDNVNIQQSSYVAASSYPNNVLSTTTYYVTETNAVGCESTATPITFTVNTAPAMTLSASTAAVCAGSSSSAVTLTSLASNYDTYTWTPSATVTGNSSTGWSFAPIANTTYTLTGTNTTSGCSNVANLTVAVNALPGAISVSPASTILCNGNIQALSANVPPSTTTFINETFTGSTAFPAGWSTQVGAGDIIAIVNTANAGGAANEISIKGNSFSSLTDRVIIGPFNTAGYSNLSLSWKNFLNHYSASYAYGVKVQTSSNGTTWNDASWGTSPVTASLPASTVSTTLSTADVGSSTFYVAFTLTGVSFGMNYWYIDNVILTGTNNLTVAWSPTSTLFTDASATTAYTGTSINTVYAQPATTTTYTATATNSAGCTSSASATLTLPTAGSALAQDNENATCIVNQFGWVHFYHSSGRLIASVNSQGQNLGAVTATSYVEGAPVSVDACTSSNPIYTTTVLGRHWVITPTNQPTSAVFVRLPYADTEFSDLTSAASTNANTNDDLLSPTDLGLSKYSNGTNTNVNDVATDNCGVGTTTFHTPLGNGASTVYSSVNASYSDFSIPGFSEFWLHGSAQSSPLPVELISFQANCQEEGKVNVTWTTASEHNSANFTVEKSRDGMNWTVLAALAGAGNSNQLINYSTIDNNPVGGVNYYRLTQIDFDGASETFNIASANCGDNSSLTTVKVYPNPSAGDFYIDFTSEEIIGSSVITIADARGMEVYSMNVEVEKGSNVFHIENLEVAPGMYYIKVSNGALTSSIVKHSLR